MNSAACPVCGASLTVRPAQGRRSHKPFVMLVCPVDGRHFRGFISDEVFVSRLLASAGIPADGPAPEAPP